MSWPRPVPSVEDAEFSAEAVGIPTGIKVAAAVVGSGCGHSAGNKNGGRLLLGRFTNQWVPTG